MEPLRTLTVAGLRRDKATFMGLAVLLFLSALALTLTVSLFVDLSEREETLLDEVGAGDVFANDLPTNLDEATINEIRDLLEVEEVKVTDSFAAPTRFVGASGEELREKSMASSAAFEPWSEALSFNVFDDDLSSYREDAAGPKDGEVYVRPALKTLYGLEVGDAILVSTGDEEAELKVAGFYEDPQLGSPFLETTRFLVSDGTFDQLHAKAVESYSLAGSDAGAGMMSLQDTSYPLTEINVYLTPETKASGMTGRDLAQIIGDETAWGKTTNALFARETMAGYTLLVVQVISAILCAFSLLLFVVALVLCLHMASASIESDYANWGILKAVGANRKMLLPWIALGLRHRVWHRAAALVSLRVAHGHLGASARIPLGSVRLLRAAVRGAGLLHRTESPQDRRHHTAFSIASGRWRRAVLPARNQCNQRKPSQDFPGLSCGRVPKGPLCRCCRLLASALRVHRALLRNRRGGGAGQRGVSDLRRMEKRCFR